MKPTPIADRIKVIDVWRGFALLGVAVCNFPGRNDEFLTAERADLLRTAAIDWRVQSLATTLFTNKSHTLFALLFGIGFALIIERATRSHADPERILFRRMLVLLAIGWLHFLFLYSGDELHGYALCGLVLLACRGCSDRMLLFVGVLLAFVPRLLFEEWAYVEQVFGLPTAGTLSPGLALADPAARHAYLHQDPGFSYLTLNSTMALNSLRDWPAAGIHLLYFLGRILIGFALWRSGWIRRSLQAPAAVLRRAVIVLGATALLLAIATHGDWAQARGTGSHFVFNALRQAGFLVTAFFYAALLTLACRHAATGALLSPLASMGRLSLTNYLGQSLLMALLLAGPGLRLAGDVGAAVVIAIAVVAYVGQLALSVVWTRHFSHGPVEWAWRYLTYRRT